MVKKKKFPLLNVTTFHSICLFAKGLSTVLVVLEMVFKYQDELTISVVVPLLSCKRKSHYLCTE